MNFYIVGYFSGLLCKIFAEAQERFPRVLKGRTNEIIKNEKMSTNKYFAFALFAIVVAICIALLVANFSYAEENETWNKDEEVVTTTEQLADIEEDFAAEEMSVTAQMEDSEIEASEQQIFDKDDTTQTLTLDDTGLQTDELEAYTSMSTTTNETVLTFYYDNKKAERKKAGEKVFALNKDYGTPDWNEYAETFTKAKIDETFTNYKPETCYFWFSDFKNCTYIENIENLDTSAVTCMGEMFSSFAYNHSEFNWAPNCNKWDTSNVKTMDCMFLLYGGSSTILEQVPDVSSWNTSKVVSMDSMFDSYAQNSLVLNEVPDVSNWDLEKIGTEKGIYESGNLIRMFSCYGLSSQQLSKTPDVSKWNTSNTETFNCLFANYGASSQCLNVVPDVSQWNTSKAVRIALLFAGYGSGSKILNVVPDVSKWDVSNVIYLNGVFGRNDSLYLKNQGYGCSSELLSAVPDVSHWNTNNVLEGQEAFAYYGSSSKNLTVGPNLSSWDTSKVKSMYAMFEGSGFRSIDISNFDVGSLASLSTGNSGMYNMFFDCLNLRTLTLGSKWKFKEDCGLTNPQKGTGNWCHETVTTNNVGSASSNALNSTTVLSFENFIKTYDGSAAMVGAWTAEMNLYTVSFNSNAPEGYVATGSMEDQEIDLNTVANLNENKFSTEGCTFTGWNTSADGTGISYADKAEIPAQAQRGSLTLYAQWSINPQPGPEPEPQPGSTTEIQATQSSTSSTSTGDNSWAMLFAVMAALGLTLTIVTTRSKLMKK